MRHIDEIQIAGTAILLCGAMFAVSAVAPTGNTVSKAVTNFTEAPETAAEAQAQAEAQAEEDGFTIYTQESNYDDSDYDNSYNDTSYDDSSYNTDTTQDSSLDDTGQENDNTDTEDGSLCKDWKQGILYIFMYKNRFAGIADAYSLSLGIHDNVCCHLKVCGFIHINMAVSSTGLNHRDGALLHYGFDQASAASRDEYIHILVHLHEFCCCLSGCIRNQLNRILCHALFIQSFPDTVYNGLVGMDRITSTL